MCLSLHFDSLTEYVSISLTMSLQANFKKVMSSKARLWGVTSLSAGIGVSVITFTVLMVINHFNLNANVTSSSDPNKIGAITNNGSSNATSPSSKDNTKAAGANSSPQSKSNTNNASKSGTNSSAQGGSASNSSSSPSGATSSSPAPAGGCSVPSRVTVTTANKSSYPAYPLNTKVWVPDGPDLWGGCFPGPSNTGVPAGTVLSNYTGSCDITTANTVINKKIVNCDPLNVHAQGIVITNTQINGRVYIDDTWCSTSSFTITDSSVYTPDILSRALMYCSYTATRVNLSGGGSMAICRSCTIQDSYLHTPLEDPTGHAHNSTVRLGEYANLIHNTLQCNVRSIPSTDGSGESSGCSANQTAYSHDGIPPYFTTIKRNYYMAIPDGYCAYGGSTGGAGANMVHDVKFIENVFQRGNMPNDWLPTPVYICGYYGPITSLDESLPGNEAINNIWDNGKPLSTTQNTWGDYCSTQPLCTW